MLLTLNNFPTVVIISDIICINIVINITIIKSIFMLLTRLSKSERIFYAVPRAPYSPSAYCQCRATIDSTDGAPHADCSPSALVEMCRFNESEYAMILLFYCIFLRIRLF